MLREPCTFPQHILKEKYYKLLNRKIRQSSKYKIILRFENVDLNYN